MYIPRWVNWVPVFSSSINTPILCYAEVADLGALARLATESSEIFCDAPLVCRATPVVVGRVWEAFRSEKYCGPI
jgi:hypothetical protein